MIGSLLKALRAYALNLAIAVDQGLNTVLGGDPDETISSRVGKAALRGDRLALRIIEPAIDSIFIVLTGKPGHCRSCIEWDEGG